MRRHKQLRLPGGATRAPLQVIDDYTYPFALLATTIIVR